MAKTKKAYRATLRWAVSEAHRRGIKSAEAVRGIAWRERDTDLDYWDVWRALRDGV